jgi:phosphate:Na+ symporter
LSVLLHTIGDFERISDHAVNLVQSAKEMYDKEQAFSNKATLELEVFTKALEEVVNLSFEVFKTGDMNRALQVEPLEDAIDELQAQIKKRHIKRLRKGKCTIEMGFILSDIITSYERVSDHCSNIALSLFQENDDEFEAHDYINNLKKSKDATFEDYFSMYKNKYMLP